MFQQYLEYGLHNLWFKVRGDSLFLGTSFAIFMLVCWSRIMLHNKVGKAIRNLATSVLACFTVCSKKEAPKSILALEPTTYINLPDLVAISKEWVVGTHINHAQRGFGLAPF